MDKEQNSSLHALHIEIVWRMLNEHYTQARHHEAQRATLTNCVLLVQGALLVYGKERMAQSSLVPMTLIFTGIIGAALIYKFYERARSHMDAAKVHRDALDKMLEASPSLSDLRAISKAAHARSTSFKLIGRINLYVLWLVFELVVVVVGLLLLFKLI